MFEARIEVQTGILWEIPLVPFDRIKVKTDRISAAHDGENHHGFGIVTGVCCENVCSLVLHRYGSQCG